MSSAAQGSKITRDVMLCEAMSLVPGVPEQGLSSGRPWPRGSRLRLLSSVRAGPASP